MWSGSSDGSIAVTDLDAAGKLEVASARSLRTSSGKGEGMQPICNVNISSGVSYMYMSQSLLDVRVLESATYTCPGVCYLYMS